MFGLGQTQECALSRQDIWDQMVEELNFKKSCRKRTSILRLSFLISSVLGFFKLVAWLYQVLVAAPGVFCWVHRLSAWGTQPLELWAQLLHT